MAGSVFLKFNIFWMLLGSVINLEVDLILEYETHEYQDTVMECKYDLEGATFGYVVWGKDGQVFYEYHRRRVPPKKVYHVPGINLDEEKSNMTHIFLKSLSPESSGQYSCAVTTSGGGVQSEVEYENMTTVAREPTPLIISTRKGFFLITTSNYSGATTWDDSRPVLSVGYHYHRGDIFYGTDFHNILIHDFIESEDGTITLGGALILSEEGQVTSIAVDWLRNVLYFTDDELDTIAIVNLTSEARTSLIDSSEGVYMPESIVVDPFQGYLFWGDNEENKKKIVASALDGKTDRMTIVSSNLRRAILALDLERRRLFFIGNEGLSSCKYDGSSRKVHLQHPKLDNNVNSLSYFDEFIFWSRYDTGKSSSGLFFGRISEPKTLIKELPIKSILDVKVFHPDLQKRSMNYSCELIECSDGCILENGSARCTCPEGFTLTAGATTCVKSSKDKNCDKSLTTVNLKSVCKGEVVFEDKFDTDSLNPTKWQHTVRISSDHETEFVIFDKDKENIYVKDGHLFIKPTLVDDNIVTMGNISLIGCTSPSPHLCTKQSYAYNIVPPVKSALINTAQSFSFRYGVVTIRAKVPLGKWIFPVFNLQATKDYYNPDYSSGVVRIASVRGNEELICNDEEWGNKNLMSGVMVGPMLSVKKHFIKKIRDSKWADDFHIFSFTWTPDDLLFSVDDQKSESILPDGKTLREALDLPNEDGSSNSRLYPLDQDFYLSVGVSVGGDLEFPDGCTSQGSLTKPWKNFEVKGLLKFWQSKSTWAESWDDSSALIIDYINIKAL